MIDFTKRINRASFISGIILSFVLFFAAFSALSIVGTDGEASGISAAVGMIVIGLATLFYWILISKQRSNDISGDHRFLVFVAAWFTTPLLLAIISGEKKENRFGTIPPSGIKLI